MQEQQEQQQRDPGGQQPQERLSEMLHRLVLMRETVPKTMRWERARRATIWRLLRRIEQQQRERE